LEKTFQLFHVDTNKYLHSHEQKYQHPIPGQFEITCFEKSNTDNDWQIVEGIYYNIGDMAPLKKIVELRHKYKYRLMMDDSYGIGLVGNTGRGTAELQGVPISEFEFITASLESTVGSVGGFCVSSIENCYHMRINAPGYTYSASLPPLLNNTGLKSLEEIDKNPRFISELAKKTKVFYDAVSSIPGMKIDHPCIGPFVHLKLSHPPKERMEEEEILQDICDEALKNGVFISRAKYSDENEYMPSPSIRLCVCRVLSDDELISASRIIQKAVQDVIHVSDTKKNGKISKNGDEDSKKPKSRQRSKSPASQGTRRSARLNPSSIEDE